MAERKGMTKKIRFEVFKRDSFTCQYCGKSAPDVLLQADHIKPVSKQGTNDITNLITSCFDCNAGKSDRELSDDAVMIKRKAQLDKLQERREQIEMMMEWQGGLDDLRSQELDILVEYMNSRMKGFYLNETGIQNLRGSLRKYGLQEMLECASISGDQYIMVDGEGNQVRESVTKFIDYVHRIARARRATKEKPYLPDLYRLKNYLKSKGFYLGYETMDLLESAYLSGICIESLETVIRNSRSWHDWLRLMEENKRG